MSREHRTVQVSMLVKDPDHLPDGMYADDVVEEATEAVRTAVQAWYDRRGKDLLEIEPTV